VKKTPVIRKKPSKNKKAEDLVVNKTPKSKKKKKLPIRGVSSHVHTKNNGSPNLDDLLLSGSLKLGLGAENI